MKTLTKIVVAGCCGAAVLGAGVTAMAATGSSAPSTPAPSGTTAPETGHKGAHRGGIIGRGFDHAEWATTRKGVTITHDGIRGVVTAVSPTAITVKAADGVSQTYVVSSATKVSERPSGAGPAKTGSIADVKVNDHALVTGTKSGSTLSAERVRDTGAK